MALQLANPVARLRIAASGGELDGETALGDRRQGGAAGAGRPARRASTLSAGAATRAVTFGVAAAAGAGAWGAGLVLAGAGTAAEGVEPVTLEAVRWAADGVVTGWAGLAASLDETMVPSGRTETVFTLIGSGKALPERAGAPPAGMEPVRTWERSAGCSSLVTMRLAPIFSPALSRTEAELEGVLDWAGASGATFMGPVAALITGVPLLAARGLPR